MKTPAPDASVIIYDVGEWRLVTTPERRYVDPDEGRAALVKIVRSHVALGSLAANLVHFLAPEPASQGYRLWTICARVGTFAQLLAEARARGDVDRLGRLLAMLAEGLADALALARRGVVLPLTPDAFALEGDRVVHVAPHAAHDLEAQLADALREVLELASAGASGGQAALERFTEALVLHLPRRLSDADARGLGLDRVLAAVPVASPAAERGRRRLAQALGDAWGARA